MSRLRGGLACLFLILIASPGTASEPIRLDELWRIGGDRDAPGEFFGVITDLCVDDAGFVYVVDMQLAHINVFTPDGTFVRSIGREGDGPGEFRRPYRAFMMSGELCVLSSRFGMVDRFDGDGAYVGTLHIPENEDGYVPRLRYTVSRGDGLVAVSRVGPDDYFVEAGERSEVQCVHALDGELQEVVRYYSQTVTWDDAEPVWEERASALKGRWAVGPDDRVYVATTFSDYEVTVYDPDGGIDKVISREYESRKRSKADKQTVYDWATINPDGNLPGTRFEIEDFDKDIMSLHVSDDGTLWVLTSRGWYDRPDGSLGVFDVFDGDGVFVGTRTLMGEGDPTRDRYEFQGDRLYVVTCFWAALATAVGGGEENRFSDRCEDPMSVICYRLEESK